MVRPGARVGSAWNAVLTVCVLATLPGLAGCGGGIATAPQTAATPVASALGPQLGYIWMDSDHTLRPILGTPGATRIGQSVLPAGVYRDAATSASASLALLQGSDGSLDVMHLPSGAPVSLSLTLPAGAQLRLSPSANIALVYTSGGTSASLVTSLLTTPMVQSISAAGAISDSAVSDTGSVGFEYGQGGAVAVAVTPLNGHSVSVVNLGSGGGLAFLPGRDDLLVADAAANRLLLIRSATDGPSTQTIASAGLLQSPAAVGVSGSGRWAVVVNSGSKSILRVDLKSLAGVSVACACQPTLSAALADDGAFRVTGLSSGTNWLVDASSTSPRVLFIPALPTGAQSASVPAVKP